MAQEGKQMMVIVREGFAIPFSKTDLLIFLSNIDKYEVDSNTSQFFKSDKPAIHLKFVLSSLSTLGAFLTR
jgi:hypothetical protein